MIPIQDGMLLKSCDEYIMLRNEGEDLHKEEGSGYQIGASKLTSKQYLAARSDPPNWPTNSTRLKSSYLLDPKGDECK